MIVNESVYYFLNEEFVAEQVLNEKFNINSIKDITKKAGILATMFLMTASARGLKDLPSKEELKDSKSIITMAKNPYLQTSEIDDRFDRMFGNYYFWKGPQINRDILQDPLKLKTSKEGIKFIKDHEKLVLEAYSLGDGKITIGWGHAETDTTSKFKIGDKITQEQAEILFWRDLREKEKGMRRLFEKWQSQGLDIKISQNMWDSMISMAFNMGVGGLRGSEVVQALKKEDYLAAADSILKTKIDDNFPGLEIRRGEEKELFLKDLVKGSS